jgi:hypothetical protein
VSKPVDGHIKVPMPIPLDPFTRPCQAVDTIPPISPRILKKKPPKRALWAAPLQPPPCQSSPQLWLSTQSLHTLHSGYSSLTCRPWYLTTLTPTPFHSSLRPLHPALRIKLTMVSSLVQPCSFATSGRYVDPYRRPLCVKEMRSPCTPRSQSRGDETGSKLVSSVTPTSSCGRSDSGMGEKRVSSSALSSFC